MQYDCSLLLLSVTWSSPRWVGLDVADSWNAKAHVRDALLKSAEEQFRRLQKAGDKQEDAQRRMRETPLVTVLPNTIQAHSTLLVFQHIVTLPYSITFSLEPSSSLTFSHSSIQHVVADLPVRAASFASTFAAAFPLQPPFSSPSHTHLRSGGAIQPRWRHRLLPRLLPHRNLLRRHRQRRAGEREGSGSGWTRS